MGLGVYGARDKAGESLNLVIEGLELRFEGGVWALFSNKWGATDGAREREWYSLS